MPDGRRAPVRSLRFLESEGEAGRAIARRDWSDSLGAPSTWPAALRIPVSIILGSQLPMFLVWSERQIFLCNDACAGLIDTGFARLGQPLGTIWPDLEATLEPQCRRALEGQAGVSPELSIKGGWFDFSMSPLRDEEGEVAGVLGRIRDQTERRESEGRLKESEERFRLIADSAPVPMWVTKLDRKRSFVNRAYVDFLGITYDEAVDFDWRTILHPDDHDRIVAESIAGEASLQPFTLEARYRRSDGSYRWVKSVSQPRWGPAGEHEGFIGIAHDISESKQAEIALRQVNDTLERKVQERTSDLQNALERLTEEVRERERAEEALRQAQKMEAVGRLTGGIAHDFNNLLTPVIGGLEIISRTIDDPRAKRLAVAALESAQRGAKLTGQLLAFSRTQRIHLSAIDANKVIVNLKDILHHAIGPAIEIDLEVDPEAGLVTCDENQLENAILNLAINARDAMPDGGRLAIRTRRETRHDGDLMPGDYVSIDVSDTGTGMSPEVAERAAEPFFSTKPIGKGTGLGLAQVYGIARQAGGTLKIDSREGEGTTIRLILPCGTSDRAAEGTNASAVGNDSGPEPGDRIRIAIVDDDANVRAFLLETLEELGYPTVAHGCPKAALQAIAADPPDLVLLDFAMPGMNGAELATALRAAHPSLPIAFVTGFAESDQLERSLGSEVPVLRKPFTVGAVAALIASATRCA